jgi:hypothetical protein
MPQKESMTTISWSNDGKAHIPLAARKVLGSETEGVADVYYVPKVVLLVSHKTKREDVLTGVDVLRQSLLLSWGIQEPHQKQE